LSKIDSVAALSCLENQTMALDGEWCALNRLARRCKMPLQIVMALRNARRGEQSLTFGW
jgi:hypothetical protein